MASAVTRRTWACDTKKSCFIFVFNLTLIINQIGRSSPIKFHFATAKFARFWSEQNPHFNEKEIEITRILTTNKSVIDIQHKLSCHRLHLHSCQLTARLCHCYLHPRSFSANKYIILLRSFLVAWSYHVLILLKLIQ